MKKQILIIEDQQATRELITHFLSKEFQVFSKASANEALEWMEEGHLTDAVILDINMPDLDGIGFLNRIRQISPSLPPILMLSGVEDSNQRIKCFELGARDYLTKPFNPKELQLRVRNIIQTQTVAL